MAQPPAPRMPSKCSERSAVEVPSHHLDFSPKRTPRTPSPMMNETAFGNAIRMDMAIGGSSNTVLHLQSIARELGILIGTERFDEICRVAPNIGSTRPFAPSFTEDLDTAGGMPAILNRLKDDIRDSSTVSGHRGAPTRRSCQGQFKRPWRRELAVEVRSAGADGREGGFAQPRPRSQ